MSATDTYDRPIEIDLDHAPAKRPVGDSPLTAALRAILDAPDRAALERAIAPLRAWPEGPDKDAARRALRTREAALKAGPPAAPASIPEPVKASEPAPEVQTAPEDGGRQAGPVSAAVASAEAGPAQSLAQTVINGMNAAAVASTRPLGYRPPSQVRQAIPVAPTETTEVRAAVRTQDVVIGARSDGSGVLTGWAGQGELTRTAVVGILASAGFPDTWAPAPKSDHFHAAAALTTLTSQGRVLRTERGRQINSAPIGANAFRRYVARWTVGNPLHGQVGDKFGQVVLTAGLTTAGQLDLDGDAALVDRVRAEFERRRGEGGVYPAGEITDWLRGVLIYRFAAIRLGANWYVPAGHAHAAERLLGAVAGAWGSSWILPALPVATTDQLRAGLVRGLNSEAEAVLAEFETQRALARSERPGADIGPKAAEALIGRLNTVYERAQGYAKLLEAKFTAEVRGKLESALAIIEPLCSDTSKRFSLLDLK